MANVQKSLPWGFHCGLLQPNIWGDWNLRLLSLDLWWLGSSTSSASQLCLGCCWTFMTLLCRYQLFSEKEGGKERIFSKFPVTCSETSTLHKGLCMNIWQPPVAQIYLSAPRKLALGPLTAPGVWLQVTTASAFNCGGEENRLRMEMMPEIW